MLPTGFFTDDKKSDSAIAPSELRGEALRKTVLYRLELLSIQQFVAQKKSSARAMLFFSVYKRLKRFP